MVWPQWMITGGQLLIGLMFCLGNIIVNIPQHYLCWKYRSAEGLSLAYILITTISDSTLFLASLVGDFDTIIEIATNSNTSNTTTTTDAAYTMDTNAGDSIAASLNDNPLFPPTILRLMWTLNACMPTLQNFLSFLTGTGSLIFYFFWFSQPEPISRPASERRLLSQRSSQSTPPTSISTASVSTSSRTSSNSLVSLVDTTSDNEKPPDTTDATTIIWKYSDGTEYHLAKKLTVIVWLTVVATIVISGVVVWSKNTAYENILLEIMGSTSAITNTILYFPQIVTTYRNQHEGVLSLVSLAINVVGDISIAAYWIMSAHESVWVYSSCAADAGMQLILIGMIIDFRIQRRRQQRRQRDEYQSILDHEVGDEETKERL